MDKLKIGKNYYGYAKGQDARTYPERKMIYNGGDSWTLIREGGMSRTLNSPDTTKALEHDMFERKVYGAKI